MFKNIYEGKKVLVTGNTGFKGSWLSLWLLNLGAQVYGFSNGVPSKPSMFEELKISKKVNHFEGDIRDLETFSKVVRELKPDFVFHLAAQPLVSISYSDPIETITTNVIGTTNVMESLKTIKNDCVAIIITSDKCYDNVEWPWGYKETDTLGGKDVYSGSKGAAEIIFNSYFNSFFKNSNIRICTTRAGNVIGGGDWALDRIVPDSVKSWSQKTPVTIRNPNATRPWQHVLEPLSGYLSLGQSLFFNEDLSGESFNFGPSSDISFSVSEILDNLCKVWGFEQASQSYKVSSSNSNFKEAGLLKLNCDKALFYLNWLPTLNFKELIEFTGKWYYNFYLNKEDMLSYTFGQINDYVILAKARGHSWSK